MKDYKGFDDTYRKNQEELRRREIEYNRNRFIDRSNKKEQYYEAIIMPRLISYESIAATVSDEEGTVESIIEKTELLNALRFALDQLSEEEQQIIAENFFFSKKKPIQAKLAQKYGITRQAYAKRLKKILKKLKRIIKMHINGS